MFRTWTQRTGGQADDTATNQKSTRDDGARVEFAECL
jgi:hypothetical protein